MDDIHTKPKPWNLIDWVNHNRLIAFVVVVTTIVGIPLTVEGYRGLFSKRELMFARSNSPTTIVRSGQTSDLGVSFKGTAVSGDVSSIQIALWNYGDQPIRRENILSKKITLKLEPPTKMLGVRLKAAKRNVSGFELDDSQRDQGIITCSWDIFEEGDGALIEIIYLGNKTHLSVDGVLEGHGTMEETPTYAQKHYIRIPEPLFRYASGFALCAITMLLLFAAEGGMFKKGTIGVVSIMFGILVVFVFLAYLSDKAPEAPFAL